MSDVQPTLPTVLGLKPTFGWVFVGVLFSATLYGVTILQTLFYFQTYPNDKAFIKALVTFLWMLDTLSLVLNSHGTYNWFIIDFAKPLALNNTLWSISSEPFFSSTIALCVHLFMAHRIYRLSSKLKLLAASIAMLSFLPFASGIAATVKALTTPGGFAAVNIKLRPILIIATVSTSVLDMSIAFTLVLMLRMCNNDHGAYLEGTSRMISILTVYLITNNLLTSFITTACLISFFAAPKTLVYEALNMIISKAYTNTFLSQLNARQSISGKGVIGKQGSTSTRKTMDPMAFHLTPMHGTQTEGHSFEPADEALSESVASEPTIPNLSSRAHSIKDDERVVLGPC